MTQRAAVKPTGEKRGRRNLPVLRVEQPGFVDYEWSGERKRFHVGTGALVDGVSASKPIRFFIYLLCGDSARDASVFHDIACQSHSLSKAEADAIFACALREFKVPKWLARRMVAGTGTTRNNWPQPELTVAYQIGGLPAVFVECPVEVIS